MFSEEFSEKIKILEEKMKNLKQELIDLKEENKIVENHNFNEKNCKSII